MTLRLRRLTCLSLVAIAGATATLATPAAHADPLGAAMKTAVETRTGAVVTVKFVLKIEGFGQDHDSETEIPGIMIESSGLVITSNLRTGGMAAMMGGGRGVSMTPRDIKILVGDDTEGVEGKLIARDSERDLAWVQINKDKMPKDSKGYTAIDFAKSANVDIGDTVISVSRLGKFFDRAPFAHDTRVLGMIKKPRTLIHAKTEEYGAPIFTVGGEPVGIVIIQTPSREDMEGGGEDQERGGLVILPGSEIMDATVKAKEAAASGKPADPPPAPKPEGPKGDTPKSDSEGGGKAPQGEPSTPPPAAPPPAPK